jgi:hypothetical protein
MDSVISSESGNLKPATSGFVLAAGFTVVFNTVLSCAKDAIAPLKTLMKAIAGHDWTTQGLIDLGLFVGLGLIFMNTGIAKRVDPGLLIAGLIVGVVTAGLGLTVWFFYS